MEAYRTGQAVNLDVHNIALAYPHEWNVWSGMKARCNNLRVSSYKTHGAKGIGVCLRWQGKDGFRYFLTDMGLRPDNHSLDRVDGTQGYAPENCRWATRAQQASNQRTNIRVLWENHNLTLAELCRKPDLPYNVMYQKVRPQGLPIVEAV